MHLPEVACPPGLVERVSPDAERNSTLVDTLLLDPQILLGREDLRFESLESLLFSLAHKPRLAPLMKVVTAPRIGERDECVFTQLQSS